MPLYNIVAKKLKPSQFVVQKVDAGKTLRTVLPFISRKLGIPSMKNYVAFACDDERRPAARLDMDVPLEDQGVLPLSYIYVSPADATPKGPDGEELPLAADLGRQEEGNKTCDVSSPPPPRPSFEWNEAANKRAEEETTNKRAEEEEVANKRAEEEEVANRRAEEEEAANRRAEEEEVANRRAEEEEVANKRAEEEEAANKRAEEEAAKKEWIHVTDEVVGEFGSQAFDELVSAGCGRFDITQLMHSERKVRLNLVPDVIKIALEERVFSTFKPNMSGDVARQLASVAEDSPLHYAVLLQLAEFLISNRPSRPQMLLWSHLKSKFCASHTVRPLEKQGTHACSLGNALTFAPVGDTVDARLLSGLPAGPTRVVLRHWAKFLLANKPDNPPLFMWSKLEAKLGKNPGGVAVVCPATGVFPEASTKAALLRDVPRGTPVYTVMRGLTDLIFEKRPHLPESWMLYHFVSRLRANGLSSGRSSAISLLPTTHEVSVNGNCFSSFQDSDADNDDDDARQSAVAFQQWRGGSLLSGRISNTRPQTRNASTQTFYNLSQKEPFRRRESASRLKTCSHVQTMTSRHDSSPRQLLQLPSHSPFLFHRCQCGAGVSDSEPYLMSAVSCEKFEALSDPLRHADSPLSERCPFVPSRNRSFHQNMTDILVGGPGNQEWSNGGRTRQNEHDRMSPRGDPAPPSSFPPGRTPELQYAVRRCEVERAEKVYERNWFSQREMLRSEQLEREIELLRCEEEVKKKTARRGFSTRLAPTTTAAESDRPEVEARLAGPNQEDSPQFPSELDIIRKRLELLQMELARSRQLSRSPRSDAADDADPRAARSRLCAEPVGASPRFLPAMSMDSEGQR